MRTDDLTPLLTGTAKPEGPSLPMSYRQGTILAWNPLTLENVVRVSRADMVNLSVWGLPNAAGLRVGDSVAVAVVDKGWAIMGQLVIPGSAQAQRAISYRSENTYTNQVNTTDSTSSVTFTDLASLGPTVTALIGPSGRCMVHLSAIIVVLAATSGGEMGYEVSGASSVSPSIFGRTKAEYGAAGTADSGTRSVLQEGLTPGYNTFTAKYLYGGGAGSAQFSYRNITVEAL